MSTTLRNPAVLYRRRSTLVTWASFHLCLLFNSIPFRIHPATHNRFAMSHWKQLVPGIRMVRSYLSPIYFLLVNGPVRKTHMSLFHTGNSQNHYDAHYRSHQSIMLPLRNQLTLTKPRLPPNLELSIVRKKPAIICHSRTKGLWSGIGPANIPVLPITADVDTPMGEKTLT